MLVLGRKLGEKIMIGNDIIVQVLEASGAANIRIGIEAPRHISVHREEVFNRMKTEEKAKAEMN